MKLSKILRLCSIVVIAVGFMFIFMVLRDFIVSKFEFLTQPSYFATHDYAIAMVMGCLTVAASVGSCFLAWFRSLDILSDELVNPVSATNEEIEAMVGTSSLGTTADVIKNDEDCPTGQMVE